MVSCAGDATFAPFSELDEESFMVGLRQNVMVQINLVLAWLSHMTDGGSFTLRSEVLDRDPIRMGSNAATANGALAGFAPSAAIEMPRGLRFTVLSAGLLDVSVPRYGTCFPGRKPAPPKMWASHMPRPLKVRRQERSSSSSEPHPPQVQVPQLDLAATQMISMAYPSPPIFVSPQDRAGAEPSGIYASQTSLTTS